MRCLKRSASGFIGSVKRVRIARVEVFGYGLRYAHGEYVMSGGRTRRFAAEHARAGHVRQRARGLGRDVPARPDVPGGARGRRARRAAGARARAARRRREQPACRSGRDGRRAARARVRQVRARHRLLGPARPGAGRPGQHAARRRALARLPALRRDPARPGGGDGRSTCATAAPRACATSSSSSAPIRARTPPACGPCSRRTSTSSSPTPTAAGACRTP